MSSIGEDIDEATPDTKMTKNIIIHLKVYLSKRFKWTLKDIDETNFISLLNFLDCNVSIAGKENSKIKTIDGNKYEQSERPPAWL